ncbi:hypothetical protein [Desulfobacter vibrioformis]|uniref:hypothetical protein n=1 Tax=Desulfobacter vibrioformis TaxID=34031 RepID=UPI0012EC7947|nr:hypothetical protein [Desulfobacter vibrioformis]
MPGQEQSKNAQACEYLCPPESEPAEPESQRAFHGYAVNSSGPGRTLRRSH